MRPSTRKTLIRSIITLALIAFLLYQIDVTTFLSVLSSARFLFLVPAVLLQAALVFISVARWRAVLRNFQIQIRFLSLAQITWMGSFFSLFLPSSIGGDVFRAYCLAKQKKRSMATTLTTTALERSGGLGALLVIGVVSVFFHRIEVQGIPLLPIFLVLITGYILANITLFNSRIHTLASRLLRRLGRESWDSKLEWVYQGLQTLSRNRGSLVLITVLSLVIQFCSVVIVWITAHALSIKAPFTAFLIFVPLINLSIMVPLTINGFGLRESLYLLLFAEIGLQEEAAVALSLLNTLVIMLAALPGGFVYSMYKRRERFDPVLEEADLYKATQESP